MIALNVANHMSWLAAGLDAHRYHLRILLGRLQSFGAPGGMKPAVFRKFLCLLDQVEAARDKELRFIGQIEAVEQKHRFLRAHNQLKHAEPKPVETLDNECPAEPQRQNILLLLTVWYLFVCRAINQKKQGLTVD